MTPTQTPAPMTEGEAGFGAGQTPAAASVSRNHSERADLRGAAPRPQVSPEWESVDNYTADLLDLIAEEHPAIPEQQREWETFTRVLAIVARETGGVIDQNLTRPRLHGEIHPQRIGAMFRRACREGLIRPNGWTTTDNSESGNVGRPARSYDWLGIRLGT